MPEKTMEYSNHCAEVMSSSLQEWRAQSWRWDHNPPFGSLVVIQHDTRTLFGIVYHVETGSLDAIHQPYAYKKTEAELLQEHPQIFEFLTTTFACLVVGYQEAETLNYLWAPHPAKIHAFVGIASIDQTNHFFSAPDYLPLLFTGAQNLSSIDELLLAIISNYYHVSHQNTQFLEFINLYATLVGNDYRRLTLFVERAKKIVQKNHFR